MDVLQATGAKAFAVSLACFLIFLIPSVHVPIAFLLFLLANTALVVGFFCSFDPAVPLRALLAIGFLATASIVNLWAGAFALQNPFAGWLSFALFGPAAAVLIAVQPTEMVAVTAMIFSLIGVVAAVAMTKRLKIGYWTWMAIIIILFASNLWVLGTELLSIRSSPAQGNLGALGWWLLLLPFLYAFAYGVAFKGVELK